MRKRYAAVDPRPGALMVVHKKRFAIEMIADKCANMRTALWRKA